MLRVLAVLVSTALSVVLAAPGARAEATYTNRFAVCSVRVTPPVLKPTPFGVPVMTQVMAACASNMSFDLDSVSEIRYYGANMSGPVLALSSGSFDDHGYPATTYQELWYRGDGVSTGFYRAFGDVVATFPGVILSRETSPGPGCRYYLTNKIYCTTLSEATYLVLP